MILLLWPLASPWVVFTFEINTSQVSQNLALFFCFLCYLVFVFDVYFVSKWGFRICQIKYFLKTIPTQKSYFILILPYCSCSSFFLLFRSYNNVVFRSVIYFANTFYTSFFSSESSKCFPKSNWSRYLDICMVFGEILEWLALCVFFSFFGGVILFEKQEELYFP